ncbi:hypothetical protein DERP_014548 [Dermatophagoides pteronyssinus]|uniref:Uncharacterized protein n=1 Tax=Dermatophagoides pteronyssinus TaxID=6956 RepID=A0ABQ8J1R9_DERPT|nr:hypothetical protein DERP_014548 [Dermatophagoides pteronyssinus]
MVIIRQDSSDDESSNEQQNRGRIPWRYRNGNAHDQHEFPFDWLFDDANEQAAIPETHDLVNDLLEESHNSRRQADIEQMNDDLEHAIVDVLTALVLKNYIDNPLII